MALSLGLPGSWSYTALRRQVIRSLKRLQSRYDLINVKFLHGKDAYVVLKPVVIASKVLSLSKDEAKQSHFTIPADSIIKAGNPDLTLRLKFLLLIEALLKSEGKDLSAAAKSDLTTRFNVNKSTIHEAFNDLKKIERK